MYRIMIVEDDEIIATQTAEFLRGWGYEVFYDIDLSDITGEFARLAPHLVLMDILLPSCNGYHWCAEIRKVSAVPIVFISSASENMNIVMAMNMGGDDFISKPFDLNVLYAKVQAILRRTYSFQSHQTFIEHNGMILNLSDASALYNNTRIDLTKNEFKILSLLFENKGHCVSREEIMKLLWDSDCFIDDNTLTVNVNRLRRKLEAAGAENIITTKKGIGYIVG